MATDLSQTTRDEAAIPSETFPLYDLPQELRDKIYEYSFEPKAIFRLDPFGPKINGYERPELYLPPNETDEEIEDDARSDPNVKFEGVTHRQIGMLSFKILIATPLLAVSKLTNLEVKKVIKIVEKTWARTIRESIHHLHHINSPSPAFLDLWSRSELVLGHQPGSSLLFLRLLPDSLNKSLRRLYLTLSVTLTDPGSGSRAIWEPNNPEEHALFTNSIGNYFPNVREMAIEIIPTYHDSWRLGRTPPSEYVLDMLWESRLDTVWFYYRGDLKSVYTDRLFLWDVAMEGNKPGDYGEGDFYLKGTEETIFRPSARSAVWRELHAFRVVKITKERKPA
ncbi:hypothetical protein J4E83_006002 [Alternaria metachromatica]|uniref:uncharacterized protein n=1 Tax=Alternaria metachromatica TaxID=283354 RepID=UPI0020C278B8|nr:uncharacterized protein J4E83_006002 [Alternaria metachromatica]KAI4619050.1 hypothetical protein J4E83_006002 [Alternaria metachromatica]